MQAIDLARMLLQNGEHQTGLVLAGDVCRKHMLLDRDFAKLGPDELVNYVLFGDGAGAVLMSTTPTPQSMSVAFVLNVHRTRPRAWPDNQLVRPSRGPVRDARVQRGLPRDRAVGAGDGRRDHLGGA